MLSTCASVAHRAPFDMQVGQLGLNTYTGSGTTVLGLGTTLLSGSLPTELALLKDELRYLDLKHLHVEGTLPAGPFPELQVLNLEHARLSGVLSPTMVNGLPKIRSLRISASNISGTIPTELGRADLQVVPDCTPCALHAHSAPRCRCANRAMLASVLDPNAPEPHPRANHRCTRKTYAYRAGAQRDRAPRDHCRAHAAERHAAHAGSP